MKQLASTALVLASCALAGCELSDPPDYRPDVWGLDADVSRQDIIPIAGDSSGVVDEIMDDVPSLQPAAFHAWAFSAPDSMPVTIYARRDDGDLDVEVISPGGLSSGDFQERMSAPVVLVPLGSKGRVAIEKYIAKVTRRGSGVHVTHARLHAYCVEANKPASPPRTFYAIANSQIAQRFDSVQGLLRVGDRASADGLLKPQGDPQAYGRFIAQYAAWATLEHWDAAAFTEQFVTRTRQSMAAKQQPWSTETEKTLRALAPARWADVTRVLDLAGRLEQ